MNLAQLTSSIRRDDILFRVHSLYYFIIVPMTKLFTTSRHASLVFFSELRFLTSLPLSAGLPFSLQDSSFEIFPIPYHMSRENGKNIIGDMEWIKLH